MPAILRSVCTAVETQAPDRELITPFDYWSGSETSLEARGHLSSSFPPIFHGVGNASGWDLPRRSIGHHRDRRRNLLESRTRHHHCPRRSPRVRRIRSWALVLIQAPTCSPILRSSPHARVSRPSSTLPSCRIRRSHGTSRRRPSLRRLVRPRSLTISSAYARTAEARRQSHACTRSHISERSCKGRRRDRGSTRHGCRRGR